jgi:alpha/beta superfamily hydrolase
MHNKVVYQVAKSLDARRLPVLRFNFRGTGRSEGAHDDGNGEQGDVRAALDFLATEFPGVLQLVAGFSFGSIVGLRVGCEDVRATALIGLGLPVNRFDFPFLATCSKPKLFLQGARDQFGAVERAREVFARFAEPKQLVEVADADHFFAGKLDQVDRAIQEWVGQRMRERAAGVERG